MQLCIIYIVQGREVGGGADTGYLTPKQPINNPKFPTGWAGQSSTTSLQLKKRK
jgi:hypothetical protein